MDLSKIVTISGKPGLYKVASQGGAKLIVESIIDGKRFPTFSQDKISSLEEICIFTTDDDKPLKEVFFSIHEKIGDQLDFDVKKASPVELREKFLLVLPNYNEDAVYQSDIKKVFQWYQLLAEHNLLDFTVEEKKEENEQEEKVEKTEIKAGAKKTNEMKNVHAKEAMTTRANSGVTKTTKKPKKT